MAHTTDAVRKSFLIIMNKFYIGLKIKLNPTCSADPFGHDDPEGYDESVATNRLSRVVL